MDFLDTSYEREKGPFLSWEIEWTNLTTASYFKSVVPHTVSVVLRQPGLHVMQDNTPRHKSGQTMHEFWRRGISPIEWPPLSPDINPIETEWSHMNKYIERRHLRLDQGRQRPRE